MANKSYRQKNNSHFPPQTIRSNPASIGAKPIRVNAMSGAGDFRFAQTMASA